jgi:hypothetical protein
MRIHRIALGIVTALIPLATLSAKPSVHLTHPPPGRYGVEDLWKARVTSDTVCDAWFEGFVYERTRGQVFNATTKPFRLSIGTKTYQYRDVRVDKTQTARGYEVFVTRSGHLPAGDYRFKLKLQPFDVGDSFEFEVKPMGPPRLISPPEGAKLGGPYPDFVWTAPAGYSGRPAYKLRIVEVRPGQTKEEALRANRPWFEQAGINSTRLRYPTRARKLDDDKQYAWEVVAAAGGATAVSETRAFKRRLMVKPTGWMYVEPVGVTRRIEREGTRFKVFIDVKVIDDVEDLKVRIWNTGFQVADPGIGGTGNSTATSSSGLTTEWWWGEVDRKAGSEITVRYDAVPILVPEMFWYQWWALCDSAVVTYKYKGQNRIRRPDLLHYPMNEVGLAFGAADFIVVTCPTRLYAAYDDDDVDKLLNTSGQLAVKLNGVLGFIETSTTAPQLKAMLRGNGAWGSDLAPSFRSWGGGYVLLVGEQNIVPAWEVTGLHVNWSGGDVTTRVRLSDFPYSDCTGDWVVDLPVGRILGRNAADLEDAVHRSFFYSTTAKPSHAVLVSGYDSKFWNLLDMILGAEAGAGNLQQKGVSAAAAHIGSLPSGERLSALQTAAQGRNLVSYFGHGNVNVWASVIGSGDVGSLTLGEGCWVTAFSCLTGNYADDGCIARAFTNESGVLGYVGATEVSAHSINASLQSGTFWILMHANSWSPGIALLMLKYNFCLFGGKYSKLAVYEYNLYGCPK